MSKIKKTVVAVATVALGLGVASSALGLTQRQGYSNCQIENPGLDYECCGAVGGSWIEITDEKGNVIDEYCFVTDDEWEASPDTEPSGSDPRMGTTSGTYEQPESTPAPVRTGTTSGTYYQEPQTTTSSGSTTGNTSGTYSR